MAFLLSHSKNLKAYSHCSNLHVILQLVDSHSKVLP